MELDDEYGTEVPGFDPGIGYRLKWVVDQIGTQKRAGMIACVKPEMIGKYISGKAKPSFYAVRQLAQAVKVSLDWLAYGEGEPRGAMPPAQLIDRGDLADLEPGLVAIPVYTGIRAAAGAGGAVIHEKPRSLVALDESWLRRYFRVNPAALAIFPTTGESMEPTIRGDELILFDTSEQGRERTDGIFVVRLEGAILVKRLQYLPGGMVRVRSDNPAYEPYTVQLSDGIDFEVLGRVLLVLGLRAV